MELNNVSARIYADTFHSQREANLDSYMADRRPDLDAAGIAGTGHLIGKSLNLVQLPGEKGKEGPASRLRFLLSGR